MNLLIWPIKPNLRIGMDRSIKMTPATAIDPKAVPNPTLALADSTATKNAAVGP